MQEQGRTEHTGRGHQRHMPKDCAKNDLQIYDSNRRPGRAGKAIATRGIKMWGGSPPPRCCDDQSREVGKKQRADAAAEHGHQPLVEYDAGTPENSLKTDKPPRRE